VSRRGDQVVRLGCVDVVHRLADSRGRGRLVVWLIWRVDGREVRRTLFDFLTGAPLDDAWLAGATHSWSQGRADPPAAGDAPPDRGAAVDRSPEASSTLAGSRPPAAARSSAQLASRRRPAAETDGNLRRRDRAA
jgi:hypothetical protein